MTADHEPGETAEVGALSYADASAELEAIVQFFERRDIDVDQLVARLERATAIIEELDARLRQVQTRVDTLVPRLERSANAHPGPAPAGAPTDGGSQGEE